MRISRRSSRVLFDRTVSVLPSGRFSPRVCATPKRGCRGDHHGSLLPGKSLPPSRTLEHLTVSAWVGQVSTHHEELLSQVGNLQQLERLVGSVDSAVRRLRLHYRLLTPKSGFSDGTLSTESGASAAAQHIAIKGGRWRAFHAT